MSVPSSPFIKKSIIILLGIAFLLYPLVCFSSYIIHLKDGRKFATDRYYAEGDQLKFKRFGGIIGIQKDQVKEIEEIEDVEKLPTEKEKVEPAKEDVSQSAKKQGTEVGGKVKEGKEEVPEKVAKENEKPEEVSEEEKKNAEWEKIAKMQKLLEEKRQIMREKETTITLYKEAKATKNMEKKEQYWNELKSLQKKLENLHERAVAENGGGLPDWWDNAK